MLCQLINIEISHSQVTNNNKEFAQTMCNVSEVFQRHSFIIHCYKSSNKSSWATYIMLLSEGNEFSELGSYSKTPLRTCDTNILEKVLHKKIEHQSVGILSCSQSIDHSFWFLIIAVNAWSIPF